MRYCTIVVTQSLQKFELEEKKKRKNNERAEQNRKKCWEGSAFEGQRPEGLSLKAVKLQITWREAVEMEAPSQKSHHSVGPCHVENSFPKNAKTNAAKLNTKKVVFFRSCFLVLLFFHSPAASTQEQKRIREAKQGRGRNQPKTAATVLLPTLGSRCDSCSPPEPRLCKSHPILRVLFVSAPRDFLLCSRQIRLTIPAPSGGHC